MQAKNYRSVSGATKDLRTEGYTANFKLEAGQLQKLKETVGIGS